jgi:hypothetical protein
VLFFCRQYFPSLTPHIYVEENDPDSFCIYILPETDVMIF